MNGEQSTNRAELRSEAAHWYNQRLAGDMTLEDEYRFRDWINRSDAHRDAYRSVDRAWVVAGGAASDPALSGTSVSGRSYARRWRGFALAATILLMIGVGWTTLPGLMFAGRNHPAQAFETQTGQRSTITLPDGSVVTLDSDTEMQFADLPDERRVDLVRGRAFFQVAKNRARPFIVNANGKTVRAVGTAFEVSMNRGEVAVVLAEGKVRVEEPATGPGNGTDMTPGRQLVISPDRRWTLSSVDVKKETSWTKGRLVFLHDPLSEAVAEVNRYSTKKLTFKDGEIPDRQIVGVFSAGDIDGFVKALELNDIARRVSTTNDEILLVEN
jgi:transmembrane sensor